MYSGKPVKKVRNRMLEHGDAIGTSGNYSCENIYATSYSEIEETSDYTVVTSHVD